MHLDFQIPGICRSDFGGMVVSSCSLKSRRRSTLPLGGTLSVLLVLCDTRGCAGRGGYLSTYRPVVELASLLVDGPEVLVVVVG